MVANMAGMPQGQRKESPVLKQVFRNREEWITLEKMKAKCRFARHQICSEFQKIPFIFLFPLVYKYLLAWLRNRSQSWSLFFFQRVFALEPHPTPHSSLFPDSVLVRTVLVRSHFKGQSKWPKALVLQGSHVCMCHQAYVHACVHVAAHMWWHWYCIEWIKGHHSLYVEVWWSFPNW